MAADIGFWQYGPMNLGMSIGNSNVVPWPPFPLCVREKTETPLMKKYIIPFLLLAACAGKTESQSSSPISLENFAGQLEAKSTFSWIGVINKKIPIFLHYSVHDKS